MKKTKYILMAAVISAMLSLGSFPAAAGYGSFVPNSDVTQAFENYQADPDLNYYHSGSDSGPNAIIGVNKAYTLDNTRWKKCTSSAGLKNHVSATQSKAYRAKTSLYGFAIRDDMGMNIGVWYSPLDTPTFVRRVSEKAVDIHTPYARYNLSRTLNLD